VTTHGHGIAAREACDCGAPVTYDATSEGVTCGGLLPPLIDACREAAAKGAP